MLKSFFLQQLFANLYAFYIERKMRKNAHKANSAELEFASQRPADLSEFTNDLETYLSRQDERKKTIDDKAKSCLLVITVSATVALAGLNLLKDGTFLIGYWTVVFLISGAAYFVLSAITAVKALVAVGLATPHPNDWIQKADNAQLTVTKPDKTYLFFVIAAGNDVELNIRANYLTATLIGLRNGSILLTIALGVALFAHADHTSKNAAPIPTVPASEKTLDQVARPKIEQTPILTNSNAAAPRQPTIAPNRKSRNQKNSH